MTSEWGERERGGNDDGRYIRYLETKMNKLVDEHLPLPDDVVFEEKWDVLIAPSIVKKYTDMRCNVNAFVRDAYLSECPMFIILLML